MTHKLNRSLIVAIAAIGVSQLAQAQSSSSSIGEIVPESSMTRKEAAPEAEKATGVTGSVQIEADRDEVQTGTNTAVDTETTLGVGYKFNDEYSVSAAQRIDYSASNHEGTQAKAYLKSLRLFGTQSNVSFLGATGSQAVRLSLPVTRNEYLDNKLVLGVHYQPDLTWEITPVWNIEYQGNHGVWAFGGGTEGAKVTDDTASIYASRSNASQRTTLSTENEFLLNYKAAKGITLYQGVEHGYYIENASNPMDLSAADQTTAGVKTGLNVWGSVASLTTGVTADVAKDLKANLYATQYIPLDAESDSSMMGGNGNPYESAYTLYDRSQTQYSLVLSAAF